MKNFLTYIILILVISVTPVIGADVASTMSKANAYYKNSQYQEAINEYQSLVKDDYIGSSLFYNLGNAYYRVGKLGYAILYYEKALKLTPGDEDLLHNLQLAKLNLKDKIDSLPPFFIFNLWEGLLASFTVTGWTIIVYIFFILLLISTLAYFFSKTTSQQRASFFSGVAIFAMLVISISLLLVKMNKEFNVKYGVILESSVTVKSSPDYTAKDEFIIHEGLKVKLEDKVDDWIKIRLEDGKVGWIENKTTGEI